DLDRLQGRVSETELLHSVRALEWKNGESDRFWKIETDQRGRSDWVLYRDPDSRRIEDLRIHLAPPDSVLKKDTKPRRMNDLRIALDPGHMGTPEWDRWGAKYTQDARGRYLSEGLLVLQLAYLLRDRFVARGAEVIFTRDRPGTVAGDYSKFDPIP